jgi:hypothetical protein
LPGVARFENDDRLTWQLWNELSYYRLRRTGLPIKLYQPPGPRPVQVVQAKYHFGDSVFLVGLTGYDFVQTLFSSFSARHQLTKNIPTN